MIWTPLKIYASFRERPPSDCSTTWHRENPDTIHIYRVWGGCRWFRKVVPDTSRRCLLTPLLVKRNGTASVEESGGLFSDALGRPDRAMLGSVFERLSMSVLKTVNWDMAPTRGGIFVSLEGWVCAPLEIECLESLKPNTQLFLWLQLEVLNASFHHSLGLVMFKHMPGHSMFNHLGKCQLLLAYLGGVGARGV